MATWNKATWQTSLGGNGSAPSGGWADFLGIGDQSNYVKGQLGYDAWLAANQNNPKYWTDGVNEVTGSNVRNFDQGAALKDFWDAKAPGYTSEWLVDGQNNYTRLLDPSGNVVVSGYYDDSPGWFEQAVPLVIGGIATAGLASALGGIGAGAGSGAAGSLTGSGALDAYAAMDAAYGGAGLGSAGAAGAASGAGAIAGGSGIAGSLGGASTVGEAAGLAGGSGLTGSLGTAGATGTTGGIGNALATLGKGMTGNGLASLIGTGISTAGNLYAQSQAADALKGATAESNALQKYMYDTTRSDNLPALSARNNALVDLQSLLKNPNSITSEPSYAFGMNEGAKSLNSGAAARGMTYSGAQQKALTRYGQDYAGTKLNDSFNRLASLAGLGQTGAGTIANAGANYANQAGANTTALGSAMGSNALLTGQTIGNAVNGLTAYGQRNGWWGG